MAKDDYDVIVFKLLTYLYAVAKRKIPYNKQTFDAALKMEYINEEYFAYVIYMMLQERLIDGITVTKVWGNEFILAGNIADTFITADGIHYLKENSTMNKIKEWFKENVEYITKLITMIDI